MARKSIIIALENETDVPGEINPAPVDQEISAAETLEIERRGNEINDVINETEEVVLATEDAEERIETLNEIAEIAEDSQQEGGMNEQSARLADIAVESLGIVRGNRKLIPSLEAFGSRNTRATGTRIAIEGIKESAIKLWEKIKETFAKLWEKLKGFAVSLIENYKLLLKYLEGIKAKIPEVAFKSKKQLTNTGILKALSNRGKVDFKGTMEILENTKKLSEVRQNFGEALVVDVEAIGNLFNSAEFNQQDYEKVAYKGLNEFVKLLETKLPKIGSSKSEGSDGSTGTVTNYGQFCNKSVIQVEVTQRENIYRADFSMGDLDEESAQHAEQLEQLEAEKIIDAAILIVKESIDQKAAFATAEKAVKSSQAAAEKAIKALRKEIKSDDPKQIFLKEAAHGINEINKDLTLFIAKFPGIIYHSCKAAGDYVKASYEANKKLENSAN